MFKSILEDIKYSYRTGNMVTRLIFINVGIYLGMAIAGALFPEFHESLRGYLALPGSPLTLLTRPWTLLTHMFIHAGFFHMGWNMLFLYWFGRITGDLLGDRRILPLYLIGGLAGAFIYLISFQLFPERIGGYALGASAAVMAIVVAAGTTAPDYVMRLILLGDVKLKFIVFFIILMDFIGSLGTANTGGHLAHLGGAALGYLFVRQLREGTDFLEPVNSFLQRMAAWFSGEGRSQHRSSQKKEFPLKVKFKSKNLHNQGGKKGRDQSFQERLDEILDKIKEKGYDSLTAEEKEFLFQASKK